MTYLQKFIIYVSEVFPVGLLSSMMMITLQYFVGHALYLSASYPFQPPSLWQVVVSLLAAIQAMLLVLMEFS